MDTRKLGGWLRRIKDRLIGTGARRFVLWSGSVLLAIMLNTILYTQKIVSPDAFTDALIAIITIAPYLYQYSIYVSILIIEVPKDGGVRKPIFMVRTASTRHCTQHIDQETTDQEAGYLRLRDRNTGLAAAEGCVFQVRVVRQPCSPDRPSYRYVLSDEYLDWQDVMWSDRKWKE